MAEPVENYVPQNITQRLRASSVRVWTVALLAALAWVLLILAAPVAASGGLTAVSDPLNSFFGYICHRIPSRSFHMLGHQFGVCHRCFGVYFGILLGLAVYPLWRRIDETEPLPRFWLFLAMVPIGIDAMLGILNIWDNTAASRFVTGLILGLACATFIVPALVEIFRNYSGKLKLQTKKAA